MDRTPPRIDTTVTLETPEGIGIAVRPAGLFARGLAFLVDELIRWAIIAVGLIAAAFLGRFGLGLALIVMFLTYWLYGVAFEVLNNGMTPGKKMRSLQVVHDDGTPIRLPASMLRNLILYVDLLPAAYAAGIVSILLTRNFQRLGDLAASTLVIYRPQQESTVPIAGFPGVRSPPFPLTPGEQAVLVDYLERAQTLTEERSAELAVLLCDAFAITPDEAPTEIRKIANGLRGGG
jgi:uncharacterized RDD family membrane protein YckC